MGQRLQCQGVGLLVLTRTAACGIRAKTRHLFLSGQVRDQAGGRALTPGENAELITAASPFPSYTFWDFHLNHGVIGGRIITGPEQGRAAADR